MVVIGSGALHEKKKDEEEELASEHRDHAMAVLKVEVE